MRRIFLLFLMLSFQASAGAIIDLTSPASVSLADQYPDFEELAILGFDDNDGKLSIFGLKKDRSSKSWDELYSASISNSEGGHQMVYIHTPESCSDSNARFKNLTIRTNGQNVMYLRFCNGSNIYMTPRSKAGKNFIVSQFKSQKYVKFDFSNRIVLFDATGFTKSWNASGGDAL